MIKILFAQVGMGSADDGVAAMVELVLTIALLSVFLVPLFYFLPEVGSVVVRRLRGGRKVDPREQDRELEGRLLDSDPDDDDDEDV